MIKTWILPFLLVLSGTVAAQENVPEKMGPVTEEGEGKSLPPEKDAGKDREPEPTPEEMAQRERERAAVVRPWLVRVRIEFQRDPEEGMPEERWMHGYISGRNPMMLSGVLVGEEGRVWIADPMLDEKFVRRIEVVASDGKAMEADFESFLPGRPGAVLRLRGERFPVGVRFVEAGPWDPSRKWFGTLLDKVDEEWYVRSHPLNAGQNIPFHADGEKTPWLSSGNPGGYFGDRRWSFTGEALPLIVDEKHRPVGLAIESRLRPDDPASGWVGSEQLKAPRIGVEEFRKTEKDLIARYREHAPEVLFKFRQPEEEERTSGNGWSYRSNGTDSNVLEKKMYGVVFAEGRVLVPDQLPDDLIHRIESVALKTGEGEGEPARFVGVLEDFNGMIVEAKDGSVGRPVQWAERVRAERGSALLALRVKEKYARRHEKLRCNRFGGVTRGYRERRLQHLERSEPNGTLLVDFEGHFLGLLMGQKKALEDRMIGGGRSHYYNPYDGERSTVFLAEELKEVLLDGELAYDKDLVPKTYSEKERKIWLGVRLQTLDKDLVEMLGIGKVTREGALGLMVTATFRDSPAEKAGLRAGDILLRVLEEGKDDPIEFGAGGDSYFGGRGFSSNFFFDEFGMFGPPDAVWISLGNAVNSILTEIGEGKKVTLTYLREGKESSRDFVLEKAPCDFDASPKFKHEATGLTVRDLTFEVRHAYRLEPDFEAVIVGKVEDGSPARVGGIGRRELVRAVEGVPVGSVDAFKERMEALEEEGRKKVRLTVELLGESRFVDVAFAEDEEGEVEEK